MKTTIILGFRIGRMPAVFSCAGQGLAMGLTLVFLTFCGVIRGDEVRVELVGQWPGWQRGPAYGVAVSGNYAYVADAGWGLQIFRVYLRPYFDSQMQLRDDGFEAWLQTRAPGNYRVEVSADLQNWQTLMTLTNVTGRVRIFDPYATNATQRFYRAVVE